jgi:endonuclease YncB( thermonuclease family)
MTKVYCGLEVAVALAGYVGGIYTGPYLFPDRDLMEKAAGCTLIGEHVITRVLDGDTPAITLCGIDEPLRLIGINTPETKRSTRLGEQCFGPEASDEAKRLLLNKKVRIETDPTQGRRDPHGRLLVYIHLPDGRNFGTHMIAEGFAHEELFVRHYKYEAEFKAAYEAAKAAQKGMWSKPSCAEESNKTTVRKRSKNLPIRPVKKDS